MPDTGFKNIETPIEEPQKSEFKKPSKNYLSKITETIGSGDDAKNSLIYLTLKWAFVSGGIISFIVVLNNWCFRTNEKVPDLMGDIKITWEILVPIITLALGYAFGKSQK